jgi:hypothetical protein
MFNYLAVALDPVGNVSLSIQVVILFLLILGLPLVRRGESAKENLIVHGYLTLAAILLHTILILTVMIPSFISSLGGLASHNLEPTSILPNFSFLASLTFWSHAVLGTAAEALGSILVVSWISKPPSRMACVKTRAWMWPTFIIWTVSIINGAIIHVLGLV